MDFTPNMDYWWQLPEKTKTKTENSPSQTKSSDVLWVGLSKKTSLARILSLHWLGGNKNTVDEIWFGSIMVTGNGSPPLTFGKGRRSKVGIMLFFLILPFFLLWNQLELTIFNLLFWSQFLILVKSNLSMYLFYGPYFWSCI